MDETTNRGYNRPTQWHDPLNVNWDDIDSDIQELFDLAGGGGGGGGGDSGGFDWSTTFTSTSWLTDADTNETLNVEKVTDLDPDAAGGIDAAVTASGPTVVVFEVGGVIDNSNTDIQPSQETWIAGETAPDPGIAINRGSLVPKENRVIASHIGIYAGENVDSAIEPRADDLLFDHVSAFWGIDEVIGMSPACDRVSVINSIIAEGLDDSNHADGPHSRGYLVNDELSSELCTYGCLFATNNRRQPWAKSDHVLLNNYIFNAASSPHESGNMIKFSNGSPPDITAVGIVADASSDSDTNEALFQDDGNVYIDDIDEGAFAHDTGEMTFVDNPPIKPSGLDLSTHPVASADLETWIRDNCGMWPANRPSFDQTFFTDRFNDTFSGTVDDPSEVGGYPDYTATSHSLSVPSTNIVDWVKDNHTAAVE